MEPSSQSTQKPAKVSILAFSLLLFGAAAAIFLVGGAEQGAPGVFLVVAGLTLLICPPQVGVEGKLWALLGGFLFFGASALLPQSWFGVPEWRQHLQGLPIPLGTQVSPVPTETAFYLGMLVLGGVFCLYELTHPLRFRFLLGLTTGAVVVCLVYALLSIYSLKTGWKYPFDDDPSFGFFPNRNQTGTFLVTGCILALGVMSVAGNDGKWVQGLVAAVGLAGCGTALLIYSDSRGGILFLLIGILVWLAGIGRSRWSKPFMISFVTLFIAGGVLFLVSKGGARNRLVQQIKLTEESSQQGGKQNFSGDSEHSSLQNPTIDGRILIYKDTWRMIRQYPITGVGLGAYRYVYPFYQKDSLSESTSIHPESDWLMVAAECGLPALTVLLLGTVALFTRIRFHTEHSYWPLRWGFVCAALTAILHGLVDVPAHRMGLGWWILLIAGAGLQISRKKETPPQIWQRLIFWMAGLAALWMGVFLIRAEWFSGKSSPAFQSHQASEEVYALSKIDEDKAAQLSTLKIAQSPMAEYLYYQKGLIRLHSEGTDAEVDALFAAERALYPSCMQTPITQGLAWINNDTTRTAALWMEALNRMRKIDQAQGIGMKGTLAKYENLLWQSEKYPDLQRKLYAAAGQDTAMTLVWLKGAAPTVVAEELPKLSQNTTFLESLQKEQRFHFLRTWYEKGDRNALFEFAAQHPDWQDSAWSLQIRQLVDEKNYQAATRAIMDKHHLDLTLPKPGTVKALIVSEESENPVVNFEYFWKAGNAVTAHRILEEARVNIEKSGKAFPEIWQKSTALAMHDEKWDLAWIYLQHYLRESGQTESLWER